METIKEICVFETTTISAFLDAMCCQIVDEQGEGLQIWPTRSLGKKNKKKD